jgi:hypothetical protein
MDPEIMRQIRTLTELVEENNKILHSLQRTQRWANFFSFVKWAIIIGITLWSYVIIQPYLDGATKDYQNIRNIFGAKSTTSTTTAQGIPSFDAIRKLFSK